DAELSRLSAPRPLATANAAKILEPQERPNSFTKRRLRPNSRDCSKRCFRTARSIAELFLLPTVRHSTCWPAATRQEIGGVSGTTFATFCSGLRRQLNRRFRVTRSAFLTGNSATLVQFNRMTHLPVPRAMASAQARKAPEERVFQEYRGAAN